MKNIFHTSTTSRPRFKTNTDIETRKQLLKFIYNIGIFVTYALIKSMKPDAWNVKYADIPLKGNRIPGKQKDKAIVEWVRNCINPFQILVEFSRLGVVRTGLHSGIAVPPPAFDTFLRQTHSYKTLPPEEKELYEVKARASWIELNNLYKKNKMKEFNPNDPLQSDFELDEQTYFDLINAFGILFKKDFERLNKIEEGLDDVIKAEISIAKPS